MHTRARQHARMRACTHVATGVVMEIDANDERGRPYAVRYSSGDTHCYSKAQFATKLYIEEGDTAKWAQDDEIDLAQVTEGTRVWHETRGIGVVVVVDPGNDRGKPYCVRFAEGDIHHYNEHQLIEKFSVQESRADDDHDSEEAVDDEPDEYSRLRSPTDAETADELQSAAPTDIHTQPHEIETSIATPHVRVPETWEEYCEERSQTEQDNRPPAEPVVPSETRAASSSADAQESTTEPNQPKFFLWA